MPEPTSANEQVVVNVLSILGGRGLSRRKLAPLVGWSIPATHRRLSNRHPLTVDDVVHLAAALGVPVADLLEGIESATRPEPAGHHA
jgi:transcriptional regulator with XRE-family HTH domain